MGVTGAAAVDAGTTGVAGVLAPVLGLPPPPPPPQAARVAAKIRDNKRFTFSPRELLTIHFVDLII
jgi:hypothetical protein